MNWFHIGRPILLSKPLQWIALCREDIMFDIDPKSQDKINNNRRAKG